jgi:cell division protein FtsI (penicillin-binding protein 3)
MQASTTEQMSNPAATPSSSEFSGRGTVVLDVQQGGIVVPSFIGKSVRAAAEMAQESGLDLDSVGSGMAHDQSPPPGSHVPAGTQVIVRFAR